jgi:hypothetical protein
MKRISSASVSSVASNAASVQSTTRATPVKRAAPPVSTADLRQQACVDSFNGVDGIFNSEKAVVVGNLGRKPIDEKKSMESMSTPCPAEPPGQPLLALNVKPIETEFEKENQTLASPPVPVETPASPVFSPVRRTAGLEHV